MNVKRLGSWHPSWKNVTTTSQRLWTNVTSGGKKVAAAITSYWRMGSTCRTMEPMNLFETHDRDRRAEGARGFWTSLTLLGSTVLLGFGLATTPVAVTATPKPVASDQARVERLQTKVTEQENDLRQLRTLFRECLQTGCSPVVEDTPQTVLRSVPADRGERVVKVETRTVTTTQPATTPTTKAPQPSPKPSRTPDPVIKETTDTVKDATRGVVEGVLGGVKKATNR